jgi:carbonic anhydrase
MSANPEQLFANNRAWAEALRARQPDFFARLARQQRPEYLWIGCADSRVPANEIVGLLPGELFVHRNIANVVLPTDLNVLSVLQFAVDLLQVKHVIVCGHYGCSGVRAALRGERVGLADLWLRHVQDVRAKYAARLDALPDEETRCRRLCELNVIEQARHVLQTPIVAEAWQRRQPLTVHGWIYGIEDGLLRDLGVRVNSPEGLADLDAAAAALFARAG